MSRKTKPPTVKTVARALSSLQRAMAVVYADEGRHELTRTNEHGTIVVTWKSGREVLNEKDKPEEGR